MLGVEYLIEEVTPGKARLFRVRGRSKVLLCQHGGSMADCIEADKAYREPKRPRVPVDHESNVPQAELPKGLHVKFAGLDARLLVGGHR